MPTQSVVFDPRSAYLYNVSRKKVIVCKVGSEANFIVPPKTALNSLGYGFVVTKPTFGRAFSVLNVKLSDTGFQINRVCLRKSIVAQDTVLSM